MDRPILLTLKKLKKPLDLAKGKLHEIEQLVKKDDLSKVVIQGLFVLAVSSFEIMITDILIYYLKWVPQKLDTKEIKVSKDELLSSHIVEIQIEKTINSLTYKNLSEVIDYFLKTLSISLSSDEETYVNQILEIKETRNLLLHNNLIVNCFYIEKAGPFKRTDNLGQELVLDKKYLSYTIDVLYRFVDVIEKRIIEKYSGYTKIAALRRLWDYLFDSAAMKFDDYWHLNEDTDNVIALKRCKYEPQLANSELIFLGVWRAHFNGDTEYLKRFNMKSLDNRKKAKMIYFLSIASEISFE